MTIMVTVTSSTLTNEHVLGRSRIRPLIRRCMTLINLLTICILCINIGMAYCQIIMPQGIAFFMR